MTDKKEWKAFESTFDRILTAITSIKSEELNEPIEWLTQVVRYNVPHGKRNRGLAVVATAQLIWAKENLTPTEDEMESARVLGWTIEFLQAYSLVVDDFVDQSITRRGQICWYKTEDVGLIALNDAILLDESIYHILSTFFSDKDYYIDICDLIQEVSLFTSYGQCMDTRPMGAQKVPKLETYTTMRYNTITKFKTGYYSFVLPVRIAMYMCMIKSKEEHKYVEEILLKIGHLFQMQDDYLDCWGDPAITGKIGTDIEDGKCSWPLVTALQMASGSQIEKIRANVAKRDGNCVRRVKEVFNELKLRDVFRIEADKTYNEICRLIDGLKHMTKLDPKIFTEILKTIWKREK